MFPRYLLKCLFYYFPLACQKNKNFSIQFLIHHFVLVCVETNPEAAFMSSLNNKLLMNLSVCPLQSVTLCVCESACGKGQGKKG